MKKFERTVAFCAIFLKIGIARLGDSDEYFIGPEAPGIESIPENGFKDDAGQVKRQAVQRVRLGLMVYAPGICLANNYFCKPPQ